MGGGRGLEDLCGEWSIWSGCMEVFLEWDLVGGRVHFEVGIGCQVCFWIDRRCGAMLLKDESPSLFSIAVAKEAWVWGYGMGQGMGGS